MPHDRSVSRSISCAGFLAKNRVRLTLWIICVNEINKREIKRCGRMDNLRRATLHKAKGRPQDFMAVDQIAQALLEDLNIERADDAITAYVRKRHSVFTVIVPDEPPEKAT